jgi:hypothetical protein
VIPLYRVTYINDCHINEKNVIYDVNLKGCQYLYYSSFWLNWYGKLKYEKTGIQP